MVRIFQICLTDNIVNIVKQLGHDGAARKIPLYDARLRNSWDGSEAYRTEDFRYYSPVATVDTDDLDTAFEVSNGMGDRRLYGVLPGCRPRSLSVGDIVENRGRYFMVDPVGFQEVQTA